MTKDMVWGVVRALLSGGSGYLIGKGIVDAETAAQVIGAIGVLFTAGWSIAAKRGAIG